MYADECSRRAAEWVRDNIGTTIVPPSLTEGSTVVHCGSWISPSRSTRSTCGPT